MLPTETVVFQELGHDCGMGEIFCTIKFLEAGPYLKHN